MENLKCENSEKLIKKFEEKFPEMIEKNQCIYIEPIAQFIPEIIEELKIRWNIEFKCDETTGQEIFMCPKSRKE